MSGKTGLLSLSDLVWGFIQLTRERWPNATFPIWFSPVWDIYFYDLRRKIGLEFPEFEQAVGFFEWDAPHPHNPALRELLQTAHAYEKLWVDEHGRMYPTRPLEHNLPTSLFREMLLIAKEHEGLLMNINRTSI